MSIFTNRELAIFLWTTVLLVWATTRREVRESMLQVANAALNFKIVSVLLLFAGYIIGWVRIAERADVWNDLLIKDTVLWFLFAGTALLFQFNQAGTEDQFFRRAALRTVEISVFLDFFLSIPTLDLVAELVLVPVVGFLTLLVVFTSSRNEYAWQKRFWEYLLIGVVVWLIWDTARNVYVQREDLDLATLARSLTLVIWLPLVSLPFIYFLSLFAGYESAFIRMRVANGGRPASLPSRFALIVGLNGRLREVHAFSGPWAKKAATATTFSDAWKAVREFRRELAKTGAAEQERLAKLVRYAGMDGVDGQGRRLDQREFEETKGALRWIATC
jgi:hypothetical protein